MNSIKTVVRFFISTSRLLHGTYSKQVSSYDEFAITKEQLAFPEIQTEGLLRFTATFHTAD